MCRNIYLFVVSTFIGTRYIEARVYCQDTNARPWMPLGLTCPVICANILNAINSLIMTDYKNTINDQFEGRQKFNKKVQFDDDYVDDIILNRYHAGLRKINDSIPSNAPKMYAKYNKRFKKLEDININTNHTTLRPDGYGYYNQYNAIFRNLQNVKDILRRSNNKDSSKFKIKNKMAGKCWYMEKFTEKLLLGRIGYRPCTRRSSFDGKFIQIMTNILNKYADSLFKFTDEMTEVSFMKLICIRKTVCIRQKKIETYLSTPLSIIQKYYIKAIKWPLWIPNNQINDNQYGNRDYQLSSVIDTNLLNSLSFQLLLENVFVGNTDLRNNIFDVNKLLKYLRKSVDLHKNHSHGHVVTLKSKQCLTLALPGCFCKPGYVESSGQCVHPSDCVPEKYNHYLARIIVL